MLEKYHRVNGDVPFFHTPIFLFFVLFFFYEQSFVGIRSSLKYFRGKISIKIRRTFDKISSPRRRRKKRTPKNRIDYFQIRISKAEKVSVVFRRKLILYFGIKYVEKFYCKRHLS